MAYDPALHRRRATPLPLYDYAAPRRHLVTACAQHRACLFGEAAAETGRLSAAGVRSGSPPSTSSMTHAAGTTTG